jgi:hypothetical protein
MKEFTEEFRYKQAKSKVENLRSFYLHLIAYIVFNLVISILKIIRNLNNGETFHEAFFDFGTIAIWVFWGVGILFHAFSVFGLDRILGTNWEAKKLKQYLDEENHFSNR